MNLPAVAYVDFASNLLPLGAGVLRWRVLGRPARFFFGFVLFGVLTEAVSYVMASNRIPNLPVLQVYHLAGYLLLLHILSCWIRKQMLVRTVRTAMGLYILGWFVTKFSVEPFSGLDVYTFPAVAVVITATSLAVLFSTVSDGTGGFLETGRFWFAGGTFLYFISNIVFFSTLYRYLHLDREMAVTVWSVHWAINILVNAIYAWGFFVGRENG